LLQPSDESPASVDKLKIIGDIGMRLKYNSNRLAPPGHEDS